ncbi:MAG: hypothetical protein ACPG5P_07280, partial [Saprospiraceae bacterium]
KSKRKLNDSQIKLLEEFIYIEEKEIYYESPKIYPSSLKCYSPKHTLFFYGNGKIIRHYDICFHCNQVKENGKENIYPINFEEIKKLFVSLDIPTAGEELSNFIRGNN